MKKNIVLSTLLCMLLLGACTRTAQSPTTQPTGSPTQSSAPAAEAKPLPSGWQRYEDGLFGYTIGYPADFRVGNNDDRRIEIAKKDGQPAAGVANNAYVWVFDYDVEKKTGSADPVDKRMIESLLSYSYGETRALTDEPGQKDWFTYTRDPNQPLAGRNAAMFYATKVWERPQGSKEIRYIIPNGPETYVVGGIISATSQGAYSINEDQLQEILNTLSIPVKSSAEAQALWTVQAFYDAYNWCGKAPPQEAKDRVTEYCQNNSGMTTGDFEKNLEAGGTAKAGANPVVCAQSVHESIRATSAKINGDSGTVEVTAKAGTIDTKITVAVKKVNGEWKVDNITCPRP